MQISKKLSNTNSTMSKIPGCGYAITIPPTDDSPKFHKMVAFTRNGVNSGNWAWVHTDYLKKEKRSKKSQRRG